MKKKTDQIKTLGIDLAKNHYQVHGLDKNQKAVFTKSFSRKKLIEFLVNLKPCKIGMEACGGSNYLALLFTEFGHDVKLIAPQYVKPFVKGNKNDQADAEAICIAMLRPEMRFVAIKRSYHQDIQSIHRIRSRLVKNKTALMNEIRGLLTEQGTQIKKGVKHLKAMIHHLFESPEPQVTPMTLWYLGDLRTELSQIEEQLERYQRKLETIQKENPECQKLSELRGIGTVCSTILAVALADPDIFTKGRHFSAWVGLVPRHSGTGGRNINLGISKRGDRYIRSNLIQGSRTVVNSVLRKVKGHHVLDPLDNWLYKIYLKHGYNKAAVAMANKNARIAWAVIKTGKTFDVEKAFRPLINKEAA